MTEPTTIVEQDIWPMLNRDATLVTVNRRLARYLTAGYTAYQLNEGHTAWETPEIIPFSVWLQRIYDQAALAACARGAATLPVLLTPVQELRVWENVIDESAYGKGLLQIPEAAKIAMQAWEICASWRLPMNEISQAAPDDTLAFLAWADQFQSKCRENQWQDNERLGDAVADLFRSLLIRPPEALVMAGFDELSPLEKSVIDAACAYGAELYALAPPSPNHTLVKQAFADTESEMTAAAKWVRARLEQNPAGRIGVIVFDLASVREKVIRIFDDVLHPGLVLSIKNPQSRIYNVSLGQSLSRYPVVADALLFLHMACSQNVAPNVTPNVTIDEYSQWLRSPFWAGGEKEFTARAILDAEIRKIGDTDIPIRRFMELSKKISSRIWGDPGNIAVLLGCMHRWMDVIEKIPESQKPSFWAETFARLLDTAGWPGDRTLESDEYQSISAWQDSLRRFAEMDLVMPDMDMAFAFADFKRMVDNTIFQPESTNAPVQVMGLLEPAGEAFDFLWIMGLHEERWPQPPRPNPLLPVGAQRRHNVPHASVEREYGFARQILNRLLASAGQIMVSYPVSDGETELFPSSLIAGIPDRLHPEMQMRSSYEYWSQIQASISLEQIQDLSGPPIEDNTPISGGTGILKAQAACPFSAFAKYRLKAERIETPIIGLNAAKRGGLVHRALQYVWEILQSHQGLINRNAYELADAVAEAVGRAIDEQAKNQPGAFTERFSVLERDRLKSLLIQWLEQEKQRSSFTVVQREKKISCRIGGIELQMIADRIDRTDDGRLVIVDYEQRKYPKKTGLPGAWPSLSSRFTVSSSRNRWQVSCLRRLKKER